MGLFAKREESVGAAKSEVTEPAGKGADAPGGPIEGDRGIPPVHTRSYQSRGQLILLVGGVLLMVGLMWLVNRPSAVPKVAPNDPHATQAQRFDEQRPTGQVLPTAVSRPAMFEPTKPVLPPVASDASRGQSAPAVASNAARSGSGGQGTRRLTALEKRMRSKTVYQDLKDTRGAAAPRPVAGFAGLQSDGSVLSPEALALASSMAGVRSSSGAAAPTRPESAGGGSGKDANNTDEGGVGAILRPTRLEGASASRLADRTLMLAQGKLIDCMLDTAISTVVAGMVKCTLSRDVYGEDGRVVLLDRGTELTGEYRSNLRTGQSRLGILWSRAKTPTGVIIDLASPATDSLGRGGVDGFLDTHFWQRYGAAILLSSLDDALAFAVSRANTNQIYVPTNTTRTGQDAASVALENDIHIPPTIVLNQGSHVAVFVARDLDFRSVYAYRAPPVAAAE
jgi:type IV secretion system protein VirB10